MTNTVRSRDEIPDKYKWDVESVFASVNAWEAEFARVDALLPSLARFQSRLGENALVLLDWFSSVEELGKALGLVLLYARMNNSVDTAESGAAAQNDRARGLAARASAAMSFAEPELLAIGHAKVLDWMKQEPRLAVYDHYFDALEKRRDHVRSPEVEELLSRVMDPFRTAAATHGILADADVKFPDARGASKDSSVFDLTQGTINALLTHPDREVRRTAYENYADAHLEFKNTMANSITAGVKQTVFLARARKYKSALDAALTPNHIPLSVYSNLIATFRKHLPTWHRYWGIRRQVLGLQSLKAYDVKAPLTKAKPLMEYREAVEWICAGMKPMGEEYVNVMRQGLVDNRWVDIYPNKGKRAGAFSTGAVGSRPFIMMSFNDDLFSLSTLAHELGHSMHKYFTQKTQPYVYANYSIFVAEVASNFNQAVVRAHLLENNPDPDFQIAVIEEAMSNFHRYFFVMPTLARFELEIHGRIERGQALTSKGMTDLCADLFSEAFGGGVEVDRERVGITWAQFPTHLYSNFYVYQYTTGISGAHALAEGVLKKRPNAVENYLAFLSAGSSLYPLDALKLAGVDLTTPEPIETTFGVMASYIDRLEELTKVKRR
jgi:oligoendopeptidase F